MKNNSPGGIRVNRMIKAPTVRLIDENGDNVGVIITMKALEMASIVDLDLVEISPNADPPVCKIMDHGKFKYEQQKKANLAKKSQKVVQVKEVKIRHVTDDNDYNIKLRKARAFLEAGNKVKFSMRFRGREISHLDLGMKMFERIKNDLTTGENPVGKIEKDAVKEGFSITMFVVPNK